MHSGCTSIHRRYNRVYLFCTSFIFAEGSIFSSLTLCPASFHCVSLGYPSDIPLAATPLYTHLHSCLLLFTPVHPCSPLYAPVYACIPLCTPAYCCVGDAFKELVADLAMQVAACESVTVVAPEDVDPAFLAQERAIEMGKEDLQSKPENIREKIVEGRMAKRVNEVALLEQPFIKDTDQTVGEVVKAAVAKIGENIKVRRFVKYNLGEGLEKRTEDFAAEVAAATGQVAEPKAEVKTEVEAPEPKAEAAPVAEPEVEAPQTSAEVEAEVAEPVAEPEVAEAEDAQAKSSAEVKGAEASVAVEQAEEKAAAPAAKTAPVRQESALKKAAAELSEGQAPQTSMGLAFQAAFQKTRKQ